MEKNSVRVTFMYCLFDGMLAVHTYRCFFGTSPLAMRENASTGMSTRAFVTTAKHCTFRSRPRILRLLYVYHLGPRNFAAHHLRFTSFSEVRLRSTRGGNPWTQHFFTEEQEEEKEEEEDRQRPV